LGGATQAEVDLVLEDRRGRVVEIAVKVPSTVRDKGFRDLRHLAARLGEDSFGGIVLHTGPTTIGFDAGLRAMPQSAIWQVGAR
jgi:hypothetical protein